MTATSASSTSGTAPLVSRYDCAMLDLDGVVYVGPQPVQGVPDILQRAKQAGMKLAFVTNNAARPAPAVAAHLRELGIPADDDDVITSAQAAAHELESRLGSGARVLVIGGEGLEWALHERGLVAVRTRADNPRAVVQGFHPDVGWRQLAEGAAVIRAGALWVASNTDLTIPTPDGAAPGNGTLVNAVAAAIGRGPDVIAGKPYRPLFDETVRRVGSSRPLVVGDRLDTDIEGAVRAGADSLLVLTGVTDLTALLAAPPERRPTYVARTMQGLFAAPRIAEQSAGHWSVHQWRARVEDGRVIVERFDDDPDETDPTGGGEAAEALEHNGWDDALAVTAAAAWSWQDVHGEPVSEVSGLDDLPA